MITGPVEKFVTIHPRQINLRGFAGDAVHATVTITPEKKYPFKIVNSRAKDGRNIRYRLETIQTAGGATYQLQVENVKMESGRYYDAIILETDSQIRPRLTVRVFGFLRPAANKSKKNSSGAQ